MILRREGETFAMAKILMFRPYVNEKAIEFVSQTLRSGWIGEGPMVRNFERRIGELVNSPYPVAVNSGTSALHLALLIAGVKPGDEVITTAQTMLATTQAILAAGARPVYADSEYTTGNIDAADISKRITPSTRAILTVDWGGYPCDYDAILEVAAKHGLPVIEDAAHALGAVYKSKPVGSICPFTCFSFQAVKLITAGDGGMLCLLNDKTYESAFRLRWYGIDRLRRQPSILGEPMWNVRELGYKYHMNDIAASIGLGNLEDFQNLLMRRHKIVALYRDGLDGVPGITLFERKSDRQSADWLFSVHVQRREELCRMMRAKDIEVSVVHLRIDRNQICGGEREDLPQLARFTETHVSLPLHNYLTDDEVEYVISSIRTGW